jgi:hypothetical protein
MPFNHFNLLPECYVVGPCDVIIGRGTRCTQNPGNCRFRAIIEATRGAYFNAPTKSIKSKILMQVMAEVRASGGVGFVKQVGSGFIQLEEASCRIAITQAFRDALSDSYRSSKKNKQIRRAQRMKSAKITAVNTWWPCESVSRSMILEETPMSNYFCSKQAAAFSSSNDMSLLRDMLNEATLLAPSYSLENYEQEAACSPPGDEAWQPAIPLVATSTSDLFSVLYTAFGNPTYATCDPFEPTPIA